MKIYKYLMITVCLIILTNSTNAQINFEQSISINESGTNPHSSSVLDLSSTEKGLLIPRMTSTQRSAITGTEGLMVFDTTSDSFWFHNGSGWNEIGDGAFEIVDNIVRSTGNNNVDDFIFGRSSLPTAVSSFSAFFFDKDRATFRVGPTINSPYWQTDSLGTSSFAYGENNLASGTVSSAFGRETKARGNYAFASGHKTEANGVYSTAMGNSTKAESLFSLSLNNQTQALAVGATAMGFKTRAKAMYSTTIGWETIALDKYSLIIGSYNDTSSIGTSALDSELFVIGNGDSDATRSNVLVVRKNNVLELGTTILKDTFNMSTNESVLRMGANVTPDEDNKYNSGGSNFRWDKVFATNGTIQTSDIRAKKNIVDINYGLKDILNLRPVSYNWNVEESITQHSLGLIAQELLQVIPEVVNIPENEEDLLGVNYSELIPVLIKAIQDLNSKLENQSLKIEGQEAQIAQLKKYPNKQNKK